MLPNKQNIDVQKTVETTLMRAKGWCFARYPSSLYPESHINIDVRYMGENLPFLFNATTNPEVKEFPISFQKKPVFLHLRRGQSFIEFKRVPYFDPIKLNEKRSYSIFIHGKQGEEYRIVQTLDGKICEKGNHLLLWALEKDPELSHYVSIISNKDKRPKAYQISNWELNKIMTKTRER